MKILLRKACTDIIFTCDQLYMVCGLWRNFWTLYRVTKFKKLSKIMHFHFHVVSHRHLIFKNSSQKGCQWYYFYLCPIIHDVEALKNFATLCKPCANLMQTLCYLVPTLWQPCADLMSTFDRPHANLMPPHANLVLPYANLMPT